jgi:hypothetical protein
MLLPRVIFDSVNRQDSLRKAGRSELTEPIVCRVFRREESISALRTDRRSEHGQILIIASPRRIGDFRLLAEKAGDMPPDFCRGLDIKVRSNM